jgi:hypothetical protein
VAELVDQLDVSAMSKAYRGSGSCAVRHPLTGAVRHPSQVSTVISTRRFFSSKVVSRLQEVFSLPCRPQVVAMLKVHHLQSFQLSEELFRFGCIMPIPAQVANKLPLAK